MRTTVVNTAKGLANAIANNENRIIITGTLGNAVLTLDAIGPVAWAIAIGSIGVAIAGTVATISTGGAVAPVDVASKFVVTPALITTCGSVSTAWTAINIAVAGGGVGTLSALRKYKARSEDGEVVLIKR